MQVAGTVGAVEAVEAAETTVAARGVVLAVAAEALATAAEYTVAAHLRSSRSLLRTGKGPTRPCRC
eukprot:3773121-Pleurochrysis_carterae.AAC.1